MNKQTNVTASKETVCNILAINDIRTGATSLLCSTAVIR